MILHAIMRKNIQRGEWSKKVQFGLGQVNERNVSNKNELFIVSVRQE